MNRNWVDFFLCVLIVFLIINHVAVKEGIKNNIIEKCTHLKEFELEGKHFMCIQWK